MKRMTGLLILVLFYAVYLGKMLMQRKQGIKTDQMAKGKTRNRTFYVEVILKLATYSVVVVEIGSIFLVKPNVPQWLIVIGAILGLLGDAIFAAAVFTMKDSWRAGIAEDDETEMITNGIYCISRNPAFLGFDLVYIGILVLYFNWILLASSIFAGLMLHMQIKQEEVYLESVFGEGYIAYKTRVKRYFGRKR